MVKLDLNKCIYLTFSAESIVDRVFALFLSILIYARVAFAISIKWIAPDWDPLLFSIYLEPVISN